jgi:hypothetical protein
MGMAKGRGRITNGEAVPLRETGRRIVVVDKSHPSKLIGGERVARYR